MANMDIRVAILKKQLKHYQVARALGVSFFTFSHWLHNELPDEKKKHILEVIESL